MANSPPAGRLVRLPQRGRRKDRFLTEADLALEAVGAVRACLRRIESPDVARALLVGLIATGLSAALPANRRRVGQLLLDEAIEEASIADRELEACHG